MSTKYTGGFITKSPVAPTTSAASGIWTLDQQQQAQKAGTWPSPPIFIEDLFSTYLYTGNGSTQTITNGIDESGEGAMTWIKCRSTAYGHRVNDTVRGASKFLNTASTAAEDTNASVLTAFTSSGFSVGASTAVNESAATYASWTFRKQPKFFDVVTWTGNGTTQAISHNLGAVPGFIIIKRTSLAEDWWCFHRYDFTQRFKLNAANAAVSTNNQSYLGNNTIAVTPTSTTFTIGSIGGINSSGDTFVAYLFAHDAGGFPVSGGGSTNGITCGTWVGNGAALGAEVNLGYEPQWLLIKDASSGTENWIVVDNMRGMAVEAAAVDSGDALLFPNLTNVEIDRGRINPTSTGFIPKELWNTNGDTYIYIAIRRGPMKTPTVGTSVFDPETSSAATGTAITTSFPIDLQISHYRPGADNVWWMDRLRGFNSPGLSASTAYLLSDNTNAESTTTGVTNSWDNTGFKIGSAFGGASYVYWNFRRAPGFFDEVCYTGAGNGTVISHNLGVEPELAIFKCRSTATRDWVVRAPGTGLNRYLLFTTAAQADASGWYSATSSQITFATSYAGTAASGLTFVAYLFATVAGVSKVGSYTGTGAAQTINCGFTAGSRFVMIKRTDSTGDWYVWDSARGIIPANDPYVLMNSTAAEVTGTDYVDTTNVGFDITSTAPAAINANGGTFIFLAIA